MPVLELINRLDSIQTFNKLGHQSILSIVDLRLADITERLKDRRIRLDVEPKAREWLAKHGYSHEYGEWCLRVDAGEGTTLSIIPLRRKSYCKSRKK